MAKQALRILVVDDSPSSLRMVAHWLGKAGYDVSTGANGTEGLKKALAEIPDLIVSDVNMPERDGFSLCQELKAAPTTAHIPVALLTRLDDARDILHGLDAGADAFVVKGLSEGDLLSRIERLVVESAEPRRRAAVKSLTNNLLLTKSREDIFRLLFASLVKEADIDVLALLVNSNDAKKPFVTVARGTLEDSMVHWLADQMIQSAALLSNRPMEPKDLQIQTIATAPQGAAPAALKPPPKAFLKVPLQDGGHLAGVLGVFAFHSDHSLDDKVRFFFDLGVESARALRRISL